MTAVQWKPPGALVRGFISFTIAGGNETGSRMDRHTVDAAKDENSVVVGRGSAAEFEQMRAAVEDAIARGSSQPATDSASVGDELLKLAALRDQGVLSEEEFAAAEARLIGS